MSQFIKWPKYWSFSFSIDPSNEHSRLISFTIDWMGSNVQRFVIPWTAPQQTSLSLTISWSLLRFVSIKCVMLSNHLILFCPLILLSSIFPSIRVFSNELALQIRWPKYWSFSISPSNKYPELISFRIDWLDLFVVQGVLKSLLLGPQSKSINSLMLSLLYCLTFTSVHDYWKNHSFDY